MLMAVHDEGVNESVSLIPEDISIIQVRLRPQVLSHVPTFQPRLDTRSAGTERQPVNEHHSMVVQHASSRCRNSEKKIKRF